MPDTVDLTHDPKRASGRVCDLPFALIEVPLFVTAGDRQYFPDRSAFSKEEQHLSRNVDLDMGFI